MERFNVETLSGDLLAPNLTEGEAIVFCQAIEPTCTAAPFISSVCPCTLNVVAPSLVRRNKFRTVFRLRPVLPCGLCGGLR